MSYEFARFQLQKCPYCDGFGHAGNDCPTDHKIAQLRGGVSEQNKVIQDIRKKCRVSARMGGVKGFSLISAKPAMPKLGKRKRSRVSERFSEDNEYSVKTIKFS